MKHEFMRCTSCKAVYTVCSFRMFPPSLILNSVCTEMWNEVSRAKTSQKCSESENETSATADTRFEHIPEHFSRVDRVEINRKWRKFGKTANRESWLNV